MARHEVWFSIPERQLAKSDVEFAIWADDEKLGTLQVSNGSVVWYPRNKTKGCKMGWARFDEMMQENARREERR